MQLSSCMYVCRNERRQHQYLPDADFRFTYLQTEKEQPTLFLLNPLGMNIDIKFDDGAYSLSLAAKSSSVSSKIASARNQS